MLFCCSVLVRDGLFSFQNLLFHYQKYADVMWTLFLSNQSIYSFFPHRFAETESTALIMLASQYKITIKEEPQFVGETFEERKPRIQSTHQESFLLMPAHIPLTFTRHWVVHTFTFKVCPNVLRLSAIDETRTVVPKPQHVDIMII